MKPSNTYFFSFVCEFLVYIGGVCVSVSLSVSQSKGLRGREGTGKRERTCLIVTDRMREKIKI